MYLFASIQFLLCAWHGTWTQAMTLAKILPVSELTEAVSDPGLRIPATCPETLMLPGQQLTNGDYFCFVQAFN